MQGRRDQVTTERVEISVRGRQVAVPAVRVGERIIVVPPGPLRIAEIKDEAWLAGDVVADPEACMTALRRAQVQVDLFTFSQKPPDVTPRYPYHMEWNNLAVIPTSDFKEWWEHRVPQETRKNVRRAAKRGIVVRDVELNDELIRGIVDINNETPVKQGRRSWHYGKTATEVEREYATLVDQSAYLGAYHGTELAGIIKMVYMGEVAAVLQLLCKPSHYDKRPANALLARAVEMCHAKGLTHLIYGQYTYGNKTKSPLVEFKRRNGFEELRCPRYYVPLSLRGRTALALRLHHGWRALIPAQAIDAALRLRSAWYRRQAADAEAMTEPRDVAAAPRPVTEP
jgi:hypothetical protein